MARNVTRYLRLEEWSASDAIQEGTWGNNFEKVEQEFVDRGVNVKWFGAVGDGQTDDSGAIQAAIDSLVNGGLVYIPEGTYRLDSPLTIKRVITLTGCGVATVLLFTGTNNTLNSAAINVLRLEDSMVNSEGNLYGVVLENFYLKGNYRVNKANGIYMERVDHFIINNVFIEHFNGIGLHMTKCREGDVNSVHTRFNGYMDEGTEQVDVLLDSNSSVPGDRTNEINFTNCYFIFSFGSLMEITGSERIRIHQCLFHNQFSASHPTAGPQLQQIINSLFGPGHYPVPEIYKNNSLVKLNASSQLELSSVQLTASGKRMVMADNSRLSIIHSDAGGFYDWSSGDNFIVYATEGSMVRFTANDVGDCTQLFYRDATSKVRYYDVYVMKQAKPQTVTGNTVIHFYNDISLVDTSISALNMNAVFLKNRATGDPLVVDVTSSTAVSPFEIRSRDSEGNINKVFSISGRTATFLKDVVMEGLNTTFIKPRSTGEPLVIDLTSSTTPSPFEIRSRDSDGSLNKALALAGKTATFVKDVVMEGLNSIFIRPRSNGEPLVIDVSKNNLNVPLSIRTQDEAGNSKTSVFIQGNKTNARRLMVGNQDADFSLNLSKSAAPRNPLKGDIYFDNNSNTLRVYDGQQWKTVTLS